MWSQILPGLRIKLLMTVLTGIVYPLAITGICQTIFPRQANGTLAGSASNVIGSELIGQPFAKAEYLQPRPSSAGSGYDATSSSGSNLGPTSAKLLYGTTKTDDKTKAEVVDFDGISLRLLHYCVDNAIPYESSAPLDAFKDGKGNFDDVKLIKAFNDAKSPLAIRATVAIPADAVTGSGSGLDPHISPANARLQAGRIAKARGITTDQVEEAIAGSTERAQLGFLGEPRVNVLRVNMALDQRYPKRS
jgi:K+-transporting ATPase ATPase C chain